MHGHLRGPARWRDLFLTMRLDGYLSRCTALSRKEARHAIGAGRVRLDGLAARKASTTVKDDATVTLDGHHRAAVTDLRRPMEPSHHLAPTPLPQDLPGHPGGTPER